MDYKKMKNLAVDKCWEGSKTGDEYRSLRIQLDHFVDHINNEDSPLSWLPLEDMTEEELSDIAVQFYRRNKGNRLLFRGLSYKGIKYDYSDLLIEREDRKREITDLATAIPELKDYHTLKITEIITNINIDLVGARHEGYLRTAKRMLEYSDSILSEILEEKDLFKCIGLGFTNTQYIEQYIKVCERICFGTLYYFIMANPNMKDYKEALSIVEDKVIDMRKTIFEKLEEEKNNYHRDVRFHLDYYGTARNNSDSIMMYYVQFLNRQAWYGEWNEIFRLLPAKSVAPVKNEYVKYEKYQNKIDDYILEGDKVHELKRKKDECQKLLVFARNNENFWASGEDAKTVKILIREGFMEKSKYNRRTAMAVIRNILAGQEPDVTELMFLDAKILRGTFREQGYLDGFDKFVEICTLLRDIFLMPYRTINDRAAYKLVNRICYEFLYIFGNTGYSNLKLE